MAVEANRVTTLELFFDLVFVFTITQLAAAIYHDPGVRSTAQVVLMLAVIWWMYGGYAWMTNAVTAHTAQRRLLLLGGMGGYLVLALAIPHAFASSGLAFGLAYLVVVVVHTTFFSLAASATVSQAILRLAPWNVSAALVVVAGGALGGTALGVWHLPLLLGIVTIAAAERGGLADPFDALGWTRAALLAGGLAVYLAGDVLFRRALELDGGGLRAAAALCAFATLPLGAEVSAVAQVGALVTMLVLTLVLEKGAV